jgi:hypothetical protein
VHFGNDGGKPLFVEYRNKGGFGLDSVLHEIKIESTKVGILSN